MSTAAPLARFPAEENGAASSSSAARPNSRSINSNSTRSVVIVSPISTMSKSTAANSTSSAADAKNLRGGDDPLSPNTQRPMSGSIGNTAAFQPQSSNCINNKQQTISISYGSFLRRSNATETREAIDLQRNRRGSGDMGSVGVGGQGYPALTGGPTVDAMEERLPTLRASTPTAANASTLKSFDAEGDDLFKLLPHVANSMHNKANATPSALQGLGPRSATTTPSRAPHVSASTSTFMTQTNLSNAKPPRSASVSHTLLPQHHNQSSNRSGSKSYHQGAATSFAPLMPVRSTSTPGSASRRGISSLASQQNEMAKALLSVLFTDSHDAEEKEKAHSGGLRENHTNVNKLPKEHKGGAASGDEEEDPMAEAMRHLDAFVIALKEAEKVSSGAAGALGSNANGEESHASPTGKSEDHSYKFNRTKPTKSRLGPINIVNFGADADVEERFRELLALEGIAADDFFADVDCPASPSSGGAAGYGHAAQRKRPSISKSTSSAAAGGRNLSDLLDMLSKKTLKDEHAAVYAKINARYAKDEADRKERLRKLQEAFEAEATGGALTTQTLLKRAGPAGPQNAFSLLNDIRRRETSAKLAESPTSAEAAALLKPRPTLVERFRTANNIMNRSDGQSHGDGFTLHDGLTIRMLLTRKLEILRRDRPLRLKFFLHVKALQKQMRKEQAEKSANDEVLLALMSSSLHHSQRRDNSLDHSDDDGEIDFSETQRSLHSARTPVPKNSGNIAARNVVLLVQQMSAASIEQQRKLKAARRDERMAAARDRHHEHMANRRQRFISLVERARGIGYEYDTGLTDANAQYRYGSEANDIAAYWLQFIVLVQSRKALGDLAASILKKREVSEALARRKAKEERSAKTVQRWWKKARNLRKAAQHVSSILIVVRYLRAIPKIQCRFRIAMRTLINRVIMLQRHFRAMFLFRRLRYECAAKTIADVIQQEIHRTDKDVALISKENKKLESQLNASIKGRKQHFQDLIKQQADRIMGKLRQKEYLIAINHDSILELVRLVMGPKERAFKAKLVEYAAQANLKFLASTNPGKVIELQMGYRPPANLFSFKEQSAIRRAYSAVIARPYQSLVVSPAEAQGIIEERGYELGQRDFNAQALQHSPRRGGDKERQ